jgi:hypothetical protein
MNTTLEYVVLIKKFIDHKMTALDFDAEFLAKFKGDNSIRPEYEYEVLNGMFGEIDSLVLDPAISADAETNGEQLRLVAIDALKSLGLGTANDATLE